MVDADRKRWNERYRALGTTTSEPSPLITSLADVLPKTGRALDIAGGTGRHAIWLAERGLDVTLLDVSERALDIAKTNAREAGIALRTQQMDLDADFPHGPWDLILCFHYLQRSLFKIIPSHLASKGLFVFVQPTKSNLERHPKPSARYLLEDGELRGLIHELDVVVLEEGWTPEQRHEARLVAQRN